MFRRCQPARCVILFAVGDIPSRGDYKALTLAGSILLVYPFFFSFFLSLSLFEALLGYTIPPQPQPATMVRKINNVYAICAFAAIGGGLFGFDISSMSGVLGTNAYKNYFNNPQDTRVCIFFLLDFLQLE